MCIRDRIVRVATSESGDTRTIIESRFPNLANTPEVIGTNPNVLPQLEEGFEETEIVNEILIDSELEAVEEEVVQKTDVTLNELVQLIADSQPRFVDPVLENRPVELSPIFTE